MDKDMESKFRLVEPEKEYRLKGTMLKWPLAELKKMEKDGYVKRLPSVNGEPQFIITTKGQQMMKSAENACLN